MLDLSKLKICFLAGTLGQGGAERQLYYAVRALRQAGASVRVLCLDQGAFWEEPIRNLGVPVVWVGQAHSRLRRLARILKELRRERPNIIQSQHFYTNAYAAVAGHLLKVVGIGALRSNGRFDMLSNGRIGGLINLWFPAILCVNSRSAIAYAVGRGVPQSRLIYVPNAVDTELFEFSTTAPPAPLTLLAVGRVSVEKRFDRFLCILELLKRRHRADVQGVVAGGSRPGENARHDLEILAKKLGLIPGGVEFLGSIPDMRSLYQQSAICVLTSDHEGTPNVLLEAMASGLPVVAARVGGVPEIVQHGVTGFLLAPDDIEGMTAAALELICRPELRFDMGARARAYVEANYSVRSLHIHLRRLYGAALPRLAKSTPKTSPYETGLGSSSIAAPFVLPPSPQLSPGASENTERTL